MFQPSKHQYMRTTVWLQCEFRHIFFFIALYRSFFTFNLSVMESDISEQPVNCYREVHSDREVYRLRTFLVTSMIQMKKILFCPDGKSNNACTLPIERVGFISFRFISIRCKKDKHKWRSSLLVDGIWNESTTCVSDSQMTGRIKILGQFVSS